MKGWSNRSFIHRHNCWEWKWARGWKRARDGHAWNSSLLRNADPEPSFAKTNWQSIYFRFHILWVTSEWYGIEINTYNLPANIFTSENLDGYCSCRHFDLALQKTATQYQSFNFALKPHLAVYSIVRFQWHLWQFHNSRTQFCNFCFLTNCFYSLKKSESVQNEAEVPQKHHNSKGCLNLCLITMDTPKNHYSLQNDNFPVPMDRIQTAHLVMVIARSTCGWNSKMATACVNMSYFQSPAHHVSRVSRVFCLGCSYVPFWNPTGNWWPSTFAGEAQASHWDLKYIDRVISVIKLSRAL